MNVDNTNKKDFMNITEFSKLIGIPASKLRYYDKMGIFAPAAYGEGRANRYRYYSHTQATTIKMIRMLTEIGVSLDTIRELVRDRTPEKLMKLLAKNKRIVANEISYLQEIFSVKAPMPFR